MNKRAQPGSEKERARELVDAYPRHVRFNPLSISWWRVIFAKGGRVFAFGCALVFIIPIVITAGLLRQGQSNQSSQATGNIATVNGQPITEQDFSFVGRDATGGTPGDQHAQALGGAIYGLINQAVAEQLAEKLKVHASDADVDRQLAKERDAIVGPNATYADWENYLGDQRHMSAADYRLHVEHEAVDQALMDYYTKREIVTLDDARNQYSQVKLAAVFVPSQAPMMAARNSAKVLTDAEALKKAQDLHAKVLAGADILAMAKANSEMFSANKKTGISEWRSENQETQFGSSLMMGKDVDEAVRKTPVGKITDIVKVSGSENGYLFAKVIDRKVESPPDYNGPKVVDDLKKQRAMKKLTADLQAAMEKAKVVFPKNQIGIKAYYDYAKLQVMQRQEQQGAFGQPAGDAPTKTQVDAQKAAVDADWEALLKVHPEDNTATLMVAQALKSKMITAPAADQAAMRDRLISLYLNAFKSWEDIPTRFSLAELYRDKQDYKSAYNQYATVKKLMDDNKPYDPTTRKTELEQRKTLLTGLTALPATAVPEAAGAILEQNTKIADLTAKVAEDTAKQAVETRKQQAEQAAAKARADQDAAAAKKKAAEDAAAAKKNPGTPGSASAPATSGAPASGTSGAPAPPASTSATSPPAPKK